MSDEERKVVWIYVNTNHQVGRPITSRSSQRRRPPTSGSRRTILKVLWFGYEVLE